MEEAPPGACVRLLADDPMARIDVPHFLAAKGYELVETADDEGVLSFVARKTV